jgi:hypothetical protein
MCVKGILDLVQYIRYASVDLPGQVSPDNGKVVDESVARSRSEPLEPQNLILYFGIRDDVLGLSGEPLGVTRRQND